MVETPPLSLIERLEALSVCRPGDLRAVRRRVRRLARDLPVFDHVWIDALLQARRITPYQARMLADGRHSDLVVGPYLLLERLGGSDLGETFRAVATRSGTAAPLRATAAEPAQSEQVPNAKTACAVKRLTIRCRAQPPAVGAAAPDSRAGHRILAAAVGAPTATVTVGAPMAPPCAAPDGEPVVQALERLVAALAPLRQHAHLAVPLGCGRAELADGDQAFYLVSRFVRGPSMADLRIHRGRIDPQVVLETARQAAVALDALHEHGVGHLDLRPSNLRWTLRGEIVLLDPGVRAALPGFEIAPSRPLPPDRFDYWPPEQADGSPTDPVKRDLYALGCVLWHLLTSRPPHSAADALSKVIGHRARPVADVRRWVPDVPPLLADLLADLTQRDPAQRPADFKEVLQRVRPPRRRGRDRAARYLGGRKWQRYGRRVQPPRSSLRGRKLGVAAVLALAAAGLAAWAQSTGRIDLPLARLWTTEDPGARPGNAGKAAPDGGTQRAHQGGTTVVVLPGAGPFRVEELRVAPGAVVRGAEGTGSTIAIADVPLDVTVARARFENIHFAGQTRGTASDRVPAIRWTAPAIDAGAPGLLVFERCVFSNVAAAVEVRHGGPARLELRECLHLGPGPLVLTGARQGSHAPGCPLALLIERTTLRGAASVVEWAPSPAAIPSGSDEVLLDVHAHDSVFDLGPSRSALVVLRASEDPTAALQAIRWMGEGSLTNRDGPAAVWLDAQGRMRPAQPGSVLVEGLVRDQLEFAGAHGVDPAASAVTAWQAPRRNPEAPGAPVELLPSPRLAAEERRR